MEPAEKATLGYLACAAVAVVLGRHNVPDALLLVCLYAAVAAFVGACFIAQSRFPSPALLWLRTLYPLACGPLLFSVAGSQSLALHGRMLDEVMLTWEQQLLGAYPNVLLGAVASRPLNELLSLSYSSYYLYFVLPPAYFIATRMHEASKRYILAMCVAIYLCCLGFMLLPLVGPIAALHGAFMPEHLQGYLAQPLQAQLMASADPPGTCFPSSHVAGAWAAALSVWAAPVPRPAKRLMIAATVLLTVSVVYCRYHYVLDAAAGMATAALAVFLAKWLTRRDSN
ncbi:phosphatase PAP2 family protein [Streptomyces lanatus]|uniref:Phosphatase PAP2 family protein n=1 Tax=Streptomyces lanatus TaxID=66900 RepID=A0ABV1XIZ2_9ACTN|nr:phosphatase PAP2 family protein [Streptomyces lanatus]GHG91794.1 PAP2 superfamily protein [Streptomyces lanatus]